MKTIGMPSREMLDSWIARARTFWSERVPRERMLIATLGLLLAAALLVTLVVRPLLAARAEAIADIRIHESLNARLRAAGPSLAAHAPRRSGDAVTVITGSASEYGVPIQGSEPEGEAIRITIAEASFDGLVRWLAELEKSSDLRVIEARIERRPIPGFVSARLLVAR